jgi:hypothetical protein
LIAQVFGFSSQILMHVTLGWYSQGKSEVNISDLAQACSVDAISAIYRNPDVTSIKEIEKEIELANTEADAKNLHFTRGRSAMLF